MGDKERAENQSPETENPIWEYWAGFLHAGITNEGTKYLKEARPDVYADNISEFSPRRMVPELDKLGKEGWELVHMQPVYKGSNGDIMHGTGGGSFYSSEYFCVFKRKVTQK